MMKRLLGMLLIIMIALFAFTACNNVSNGDGADDSSIENNSGGTVEETPSSGTSTGETMQLYFTIGTTRLAATLEDNSATAALKEKLKTAPVTINMSDYGGFEKVGGFGFDLPSSNKEITTEPCEFVLYQGNKLVIFYGSNKWSYTRLGKITGVTAQELKTVLGDGKVTVTLSLSNVSSFD